MLNTQQLKQEFIHRYGEFEVEAYFSPGRVNLIGEHIDYNGGFVLPATISLGITAVIRRRADAIVRVYAKDFEQEAIIELNAISASDITQEDIHWSHYIVATLLVLKDNGVHLRGADILIGSDLPLGSGLSSSAALECLIAFIFNEDFYAGNRTQLALDAQKAERKYVGVNCGIMDQFAVSNGLKNQAILLNCATLEYEYIPADFKDYQLVIINSNKARALAESKYNERRSECDAAFEILRKFDIAEDLCHVHEISLGYLEDDTLYQRAKHAILENKRVLHAVDALKKGSIEAFGQLLTESHISLDTDYEVSGHELKMIVHYSTHFDGCIGARMTGAGFGGCCIALVEKGKTERFITYVSKKYAEKTGFKADFYLAEITDGVGKL
ncbi:MAG TPA: galactokinase [Chitinophagales bacterium]|nr:galactokinase [Chitinophagales bacterium]